MKIRSFGFVVVLSLVAASVACNKDSGAGGKAEAASTTAGDPCAAATWKIDSPKVCMSIPAGATARPIEDATGGGKRVIFDQTANIALYIVDGNFEKEIDARIADGIKGNTVVAQGEVPGRKGMKFYYANFKTGTMGMSETYFQGKKHFYTCKVNTEQKAMAASVEACKTLWGD